MTFTIVTRMVENTKVNGGIETIVVAELRIEYQSITQTGAHVWIPFLIWKEIISAIYLGANSVVISCGSRHAGICIIKARPAEIVHEIYTHSGCKMLVELVSA